MRLKYKFIGVYHGRYWWIGFTSDGQPVDRVSAGTKWFWLKDKEN